MAKCNENNTPSHKIDCYMPFHQVVQLIKTSNNF